MTQHTIQEVFQQIQEEVISECSHGKRNTVQHAVSALYAQEVAVSSDVLPFISSLVQTQSFAQLVEDITN